MEVQLRVVNNSECQQGYLNNSIDIDDTHLCAGIFGTDVCRVMDTIFIIYNVHFQHTYL